ncbi:MAG: hypothetical protein QM664_10975, partial [Flavihumibacter sp.]
MIKSKLISHAGEAGEKQPALAENKDRVALQYGPMVYCVEAADNKGKAWDFIVPPNPTAQVNYEPALLDGVNSIVFDVLALEGSPDGKSLQAIPSKRKAIPYFSWNNRGADEMQVWLCVWKEWPAATFRR